MVARSRDWECGRLLAGTAGSNPTEDMEVCCQLFVLSGKGLRDELVPRPTDCGVSEYDRESSKMKRPWPTGGCSAMVNTKKKSIHKTLLCSC